MTAERPIGFKSIGVALAIMLLCVSTGYAQQQPQAAQKPTANVAVGDQSLFTIRARLGPFAEEERAAAASQRLAFLPLSWQHLAGFTVAFGVAGAGIAFALQEVIASVAGWVAISFGNFYKPGDRVQLEPARIEPVVTLVANDNWLEFTARFIVDYRKRRFVKDRLFTRILEEVDKSHDRIRLASATFEVVGLPPVIIGGNGPEPKP